MLVWIKQYKWWIILGFILTIKAIQYEYERRGSYEVGSEYILLFLPVFVHVMRTMWNDSREMMNEDLSEGWIER